jgi:hypothetical protein
VFLTARYQTNGQLYKKNSKFDFLDQGPLKKKKNRMIVSKFSPKKWRSGFRLNHLKVLD